MKFTILLAPVSKKNSPVLTTTGRPRILPSKVYRDYEAAALKLLPRRPTIDYRVCVTGKFYMATRRRVDLVNLLEALDDVLVKARILDDDNANIIVSHDGSRVLYDKARPRTEVTITRMDEERTDK